jgi:hypothetical protein
LHQNISGSTKLKGENKMKPFVPATIIYKVKVKEFADNGGLYFDYKKTIGKVDCNLKPHHHDYYNSDMFASILNKAYNTAINNKRWCRVAELPETVKIDLSGFFAIITVSVLL